MAETLKLGNGIWGTKEDSLLAYNNESGNYKPLPFDFTRASSATVVNKAGLIETVQSGIPRIDFLGNTNGALLLEPQSTNLRQLSNTYVGDTKIRGTINNNATEPSPSGVLGVEYLTATSTNGLVLDSSTLTGDGTFSVYLKRKTGVGDIRLSINGGVAYTTMAVTNEWKRFSISSTTGLGQLVVSCLTSGDEVYIWGWQEEAIAYPTSLIPTQGSTVTRNLETCRGAGNDQVINSAEGVLYFEGSALADDLVDKRISISDGTSGNYVSIGYSRFAGNIIAEIWSGGVNQIFNFGATGVTQTNNNKFALSWGSGTMKFYFNGTQTNTESVTSPIGMNVLKFASGINTIPMYANTKDVRVYDTALSDAELITLTT